MPRKPAFLRSELPKEVELAKYWQNGLLKDQQSGICGLVTLDDSQILPMTNIVLTKEKKFMGTSMECIFLT